MNWFSKITKFFITEEEEELETKTNSTVHKKAQIPEVSQNRKSGDIEAKITYQYPQGNFRFPIMPDRDTAKKPRRKNRSPQERPIQQQKRKNVPSQKPAVEIPASKRPFHVTEIPSPIHGFRSRSGAESGGYTYGESSPELAKSLTYKGYQMSSDSDMLNAVLSENRKYREATQRRSQEARQEKHAEEQPLFEEVVEPLAPEEELVTLPDAEQSQNFGRENGKEIYAAGEMRIESCSLPENSLLLFEGQDLNSEREFSDEGNEEIMTAQEQSLPAEELAGEEVILDNIEDDTDISASQQQIEKEQSWNSREEKIVVVPEEKAVSIKENQTENSEVASTSVQAGEEIIVSPAAEQENGETYDSQRKENKDNFGSPVVPYNVLMFQRDRQKREPEGKRAAYAYPSLALLNVPERELHDDQQWLEEQRNLLNMTFENFNVRAKVVNVTKGPAVTRLEVQPEPGVKVNKITNLADDIKLSLSAKDIRMEAPIPGKNTIGIEVPNKSSKIVTLREIIRSEAFRSSESPLTAAMGLDISGQPSVTDLKKMPHGLIAGATGSGKSVCINTILVSLLYKASPDMVKLLLIDPKMVELAPYQSIPHLVSPVITDVKAATAALKWAVEEMERRYELFVHTGVRDISRYNQKAKEHGKGEHLPYIVVIIDELADLMMVSPADVEDAICRLAQKARACGIHLIVATQRPSVDVITGLIKANIPTRTAFSVSSQIDSRTILDKSGAEKLLGRGDMLFLENGSSKAVRLQGCFVSDDEIERVVAHVKQQAKPAYLFEHDELVRRSAVQTEEDELFFEACEFVIHQGGASASGLQRRFRLGYNRAARLIDMMEAQGIISENRGSRPRDVLITEDELEAMQG
ncbi:hypothetical protein GJU40_11215 [Bacillus lacus]|uniref:FtsK domain-containing protein n=1 Tax=Metabacillus lacus TaxID=1983721 RepID=A0A7X2J0Y1_9BACI|nr:DNA translocase FtsK [Metabacillus lacus]MRX72718.1 hypothetical protein [Metabacillus lacus]